MPDKIENFSHWETFSSNGSDGAGKLAVDSYGRRWRKESNGVYYLARPDYMSREVWAQHRAGCQAAGEAPQAPTQPQKGTSAMSTASNRIGAGPGGSAAPVSEALTIAEAIDRLDAIAAAHAQIGGNEGFLGSLSRMEVGGNEQQTVREAMAQSKIAAAVWADAAKSVREHNDPVGQAYSLSPGAANKHANTNE